MMLFFRTCIDVILSIYGWSIQKKRDGRVQFDYTLFISPNTCDSTANLPPQILHDEEFSHEA